MKRSNSFSMLCAIALLAYAQISWADWILGDSNDDVEFQFDSIRIKKEQTHINAWLLVNFRVPFESVSSESKDIVRVFSELRGAKSLVRQVKVRCSGLEEAGLNATYYNDYNGTGKVLKEISLSTLQVPIAFNSYPPNSVGELTLVKLCAHAEKLLRPSTEKRKQEQRKQSKPKPRINA